jgi:imidazole glycerol-phosphate synthase subunit HisH
MIAIVNYGLGNVRAFVNVYERLHLSVLVAETPNDLKAASRLILPGVGAFDHAMGKLNNSGMLHAIEKLVLDQQMPILGVCVGMQMLARSSDEGKLPGLGWIEGRVRKFDIRGLSGKVQLPHMGWNTIQAREDNRLLGAFNHSSRFYFLHSYYFECHDERDSIAKTEYGIRFSSAVNIRNIYGVQFHPEKSHDWGIQLLKKFADL